MTGLRSLTAGTALSLLFATVAQAEPIKIAMVETLSGPQASTGLLHRAAVKSGIDRINAAGGFRGEQLVLVDYDNQGGPVGAADRVRAAIADGARIIAQGSSTAVAVQITEDVRKHNLRNKGDEVLFLNVGTEGMELTGEKCHFHHVRLGSNFSMRFNMASKGLKQLGELGDKVFLINQNYSPGHTVQETIKANADELGYTVVGDILHEVNKIQDFSPYVQQIQQANPDTIFTGSWSNDLLLLMKATADAKLTAKFATAFLDQPGNIGNAGEVAEGHYVVSAFNAELSDEAMAFAEEYKASTGHYPAYVEPAGALGMRLFGEALAKLNDGEGKLSINDLVLAIEDTSITTPVGELRIRKEDHQALLPMVMSKVSRDAKIKVDGTEFGFVPVLTYTAEEIGDQPQGNCKMNRPS